MRPLCSQVSTDLARYIVKNSDAPLSSLPDASSFLESATASVAKFFLRPVDRGASTQIFLAAEPDLRSRGGEYWTNNKIGKKNKVAEDKELAKSLWEQSEALVGKFDVTKK